MPENERIRVGSHVTIFPRGKNKIWTADFWHNGQHQRISLKTANKKIAIQRAVKIDHTLTAGTYKQPCRTIAITAAKDDYLAYLETEGRARKTLSRYRGELTSFCEFCRENRAVKLSQITPILFDRFRAFRKTSHCQKTIYHESVVIKQFLKWCKTRHLIVENPLADVKLQRPRFVAKPGPSLYEIQQVLAASPPRRRVQFALLAFSGMRTGELQRLRTEDVDFYHNWLNVVSRPGLETKTRESRRIPIHPVLKALLSKAAKSRGTWFFTADPSDKYPDGDHWLSTKHLNEDFQRIARNVGLKVGRKTDGYTAHSMRHFFETFCLNNSVPQRVVDTWQGHNSDRSMGAVYYNLAEEESQQFMSKVPFRDRLPEAGSGDQDKENKS